MNKKLMFAKNSLAVILVLLFSLFAYSDDSFKKDIDHDGFPDDLEKNTGYDHTVNEALIKSSRGGKCGVLKDDPVKLTRPDNVLVILDISGSMNSAINNISRMDLAKKILKKYIDALPQSMRIGFVIYGKTGCDDRSVELISPIGNTDRDDLVKKIDALSPKGLTPIAMTLKKSNAFFRGFERDNNNLILISDGMESCGGDPVKEIAALKEGPVNPSVTVIGLGVNSRTRKQLAKIASVAGGNYSDVKNEKDFVKAFEGFFKKLSKLYKDVVCIVKQYNLYLSHETTQYNKSKSYLIRAKLKARGELKKRLEQLEKRLDENHEARIRAKNNISKMIKNKMDDMAAATKKFIKK